MDGEVYRYCYYNCRNALRSGVEVCEGFRIPTEALDAAVLEAIADQVCSHKRVQQLVRRLTRDADAEEVARAWRTLVTTHAVVGRGYLMHLVERIEVQGTRIVLIPSDASTTSNGPSHPDSSVNLESDRAASLG